MPKIKLSKRDKQAVRAIASTKAMTYQQIADMFDITKGYVCKLVKGDGKR